MVILPYFSFFFADTLGKVTLIFCHTNASVLFCQKLKDLFIEAFQTAAAESFTPQEMLAILAFYRN